MVPDLASDHSETAAVSAATVPTGALFGYLVTVLAWELEAGVLILHALTEKRLDPIGHAALLLVSVALTAFAWLRGKRNFRRLRHTGGRVAINGVQACLVTVFMVCFGSLLGVIAGRILEH